MGRASTTGYAGTIPPRILNSTSPSTSQPDLVDVLKGWLDAEGDLSKVGQ